VYAISAATRNVTDSVTVPIAASSMVFGRGDTLLYVSSFGGGAVSEIGLKAKMTVRRTFATGGTPQGMAVSPNGNTLYVANEAGWLNAIDLAGGTITTPLNLPGGPFGLALTPDGTQLYVTLAHSGGIAVVDRLTVTLDKVIAAGLTPRRVGFSPDGLTAVVADEAGYVVFIR
jgi:YVTN family beta-propeller protein